MLCAALQVGEEQLVFTAGAADEPMEGPSGTGGNVDGMDAEAAALLGDPVVREVLSFWSYYRGCGYERDAMAVWVQQVGERGRVGVVMVAALLALLLAALQCSALVVLGTATACA